MASGLQCPGCGHVHPAGLPEIARGDATFRCYGCYRTLSVPEGWSGRPSTRPPAPEPGPLPDAPLGAGTRDARTARLAGRRAARRGALPAPPGDAGPAAAASGDDATQMVPTTGPSSGRSGAAGAAAGRGSAGAPPGWVAPQGSGQPVPTTVRLLVWTVAFGLGFVVTVIALKAVGLLGVNTAIDLYAGSGAHRFGILLLMLPVWAVLSATIAHFSLEGLARRRPRSVSHRPPAKTPTPG